MKKIISVLIFSSILSGCSLFKTKLEVSNVPIEKPVLDISLPQPVKMNPIQWIVVTDKNYNEVINSSKNSNGLVFLVALDENNYKNLALNNSNVLRYIREQKSVIAAYKKYYASENKPQEGK